MADSDSANILVVDDDQGLLRLIEKCLKREGFTTATACSGKEVISWLAQNSAELMLMDLKLPDIPGPELINRLGSLGHHVPFIVITGQGDERVAVEMMKRGALDYLVKDVQFIEFLPTVVRHALGQVKRERRLAEAEKALGKSEALKQAVMHSLAAQIAVLDGTGNIVAVNEAWNQFSRENGHTSLARTGIGSNYIETCRRAAEAGVAQASQSLIGIEAVLSDSRPNFSMESEGHTPSLQRWFMMTVTPLGESQPGAVISYTEITERKNSENALRESEERYRGLFNTLLEGFCIVEMVFNAAGSPVDYRFLEVNPAFEMQTGLQNVVGKLMSDIAPDNETHWFEKYGRIAMTGEPARFVNEARALNRWYEVSAFRFGGTNSRKVAILFNDITETKRSEEALRESARRERDRATELETLLEAVPMPIFIAHDPDCLRLTGNRAANALLRNLHGQEASLSPPDQPRHFKPMKDGKELSNEELPAQRAARGIPVHDFEFRLVFDDATFRDVLGFGTPLRDDKGQPRGAVQVLIDITERKWLEKEILEISERERRNFGHDLHDGLGQRLTGLEMLSHALVEDLDEQASQLVNRARKLNEELRETVTQARLISHGLAPVPLEGDGLMQGLQELAASTSRLPGVTCRFFCDPPILFDDVIVATNLYRIAQEAVNNALKHGKARKIDIALTEHSGECELSVKNNGLAIPADALLKRSVGLTIMRHRVAMIGAKLSIESGKRKGAKVVCTWQRKP